jgi:two-component system chemotaxis sensor kinase CheA
MESALLGLEHSPEDQELLNNIFRSAHSIKGASGTFGLDEVARFTHSLENLLDRMRGGIVKASPERLDLLLRSSDMLRDLLACAKTGVKAPREVEDVLAELNDILGQEAEPAAKPLGDACRPVSSTQHAYRVTFVPNRDILRQGMDPLLLLRDLSQRGELLETKADLSRLPALPDLDPESCYLGWTVCLLAAQSPEQIADVFSFVQDSSRVSIEIEHENRAGTTDLPGTLETNAEKPAAFPQVRLHVPLAKAADLIHLATDLVRAQASLIRTAGECATSVPLFLGRGNTNTTRPSRTTIRP